MGNTMDIGAADRDEEQLRELITELQKKMNVADHSLAGLAKSVDSIQAACKMLLLHLVQEKKPEDTGHDECLREENKECKVSGSDLAFDLLRCVQESLTDHKFIAVEGVRNLLHFIATNIQTFEILKSKNDDEITLDAYLSARSPFDSNSVYYDDKFKALRSEIDTLKKINRSLRSRIDILNKKESYMIEENALLRQQVNDLDNYAKLKLEEKQSLSMSGKSIRSKEKEIEIAGKNNNDPCLEENTTSLSSPSTTITETADILKTQFTGNNDMVGDKRHSEISLRVKGVNESDKCEKMGKTVKDIHSSFSGNHEMILPKMIVQVQVYRKFTKSFVDTYLIDLIKERAENQSLQLDIIRTSKQQDVNPDIPVLIMCTFDEFSRTPISNVITNQMNGIEATSKVAAVILHINQKKPETVHSFALLNGHQPYSSLGGIFDITCDFYRSVLSCVENYDTADAIINFIYERRSQ